MVTKKDRRHSGRKVIVIPHPEDNPCEKTYWDDWSNYRDGFRGSRDKTLIRKRGPGYGRYPKLNPEIARINEKLKKHAKIRKARK